MKCKRCKNNEGIIHLNNFCDSCYYLGGLKPKALSNMICRNDGGGAKEVLRDLLTQLNTLIGKPIFNIGNIDCVCGVEIGDTHWSTLSEVLDNIAETLDGFWFFMDCNLYIISYREVVNKFND